MKKSLTSSIHSYGQMTHILIFLTSLFTWRSFMASAPRLKPISSISNTKEKVPSIQLMSVKFASTFAFCLSSLSARKLSSMDQIFLWPKPPVSIVRTREDAGHFARGAGVTTILVAVASTSVHAQMMLGFVSAAQWKESCSPAFVASGGLARMILSVAKLMHRKIVPSSCLKPTFLILRKAGVSSSPKSVFFKLSRKKQSDSKLSVKMSSCNNKRWLSIKASCCCNNYSQFSSRIHSITRRTTDLHLRHNQATHTTTTITPLILKWPGPAHTHLQAIHSLSHSSRIRYSNLQVMQPGNTPKRAYRQIN